MQVITCDRGPRRGIWFKTDADLSAFMESPQVKTMPNASPQFMMEGVPTGFPLRVATEAQWMALKALSEPLPEDAASPPAA